MSGSVTFTMLQLVLLLIANALVGTIGQRGKWNGLVMLDAPEDRIIVDAAISTEEEGERVAD